MEAEIESSKLFNQIKSTERWILFQSTRMEHLLQVLTDHI